MGHRVWWVIFAGERALPEVQTPGVGLMGSLRTLGPTPQDTRSGTEAQRRTELAPRSTLCHYGSLGSATHKLGDLG